MSKQQDSTWFRDQETGRWFEVRAGFHLSGVFVGETMGDGVPYVEPEGCGDDAEEWESGRVIICGDYGDKLNAIFAAQGPQAMLTDIRRQGWCI